MVVRWHPESWMEVKQRELAFNKKEQMRKNGRSKDVKLGGRGADGSVWKEAWREEKWEKSWKMGESCWFPCPRSVYENKQCMCSVHCSVTLHSAGQPSYGVSACMGMWCMSGVCVRELTCCSGLTLLFCLLLHLLGLGGNVWHSQDYTTGSQKVEYVYICPCVSAKRKATQRLDTNTDI